jgi:hypothetical protein
MLNDIENKEHCSSAKYGTFTQKHKKRITESGLQKADYRKRITESGLKKADCRKRIAVGQRLAAKKGQR